MKKIIIICFMLTATISNAIADYGPYYVRDVGYCTEYELYLTSGNSIIYGTEYGCAYVDNRSPSQFVGIFSWDSNSLFLIEANPELTNRDFPRNNMLIIEYNFNTMYATAYITDGYTLEYYGDDWEWTLSLN